MVELKSFTKKGRQSIARICKHAAAVFNEKGYRVATIEDVARAAATTKGGIFHYFSTKEELLYAILHRYMEDALSCAVRDIEGATDPRDRLRRFVRSHVSYYRDNFHESRLLLREVEALSGKYLSVLHGMQRRYLGFLTETIKQLVPAYADDKNRIKVLTFSLIGMCNWPFTWFNPDGPVKAEQIAETICEIFLGELPLAS